MPSKLLQRWEKELFTKLTKISLEDFMNHCAGHDGIYAAAITSTHIHLQLSNDESVVIRAETVEFYLIDDSLILEHWPELREFVCESLHTSEDLYQ